MKYGLDEYGRYVEKDGERFTIEPYPFRDSKLSILYRFLAYIDVIKWHIFSEPNPEKWKKYRKGN